MGIDCYFDDYKKAETYFDTQKKEYRNVILQSLEILTITTLFDKSKSIHTETNINLIRRILKI